MDKYRKIGFYLKKDITKPITCTDLTLKQQLENLRDKILLNIEENKWEINEYYCLQSNLEKEIADLLSTTDKTEIDNAKNELVQKFEYILSKFENKNWTLEEYNNFMIQLLKIDIKTLDKIYPIVINFIELPKEELQEKLEYYNSKLDLHLFDDERKIEEMKVTKIINGKEQLTPTIEYIRAKHNFEPKDLLLFTTALLSKIRSFNQVLLKNYQSKIESHSKQKDMQVELEMLLKQFEIDNKEMINIITNSYNEWIEVLNEDDIVYNYLYNKLPGIISSNRLFLEKKRLDYVMKSEREHSAYLAERARYFASDKAKKNSKLVKGKFI